jgi:hypothetical protein
MSHVLEECGANNMDIDAGDCSRHGCCSLQRLERMAIIATARLVITYGDSRIINKYYVPIWLST